MKSSEKRDQFRVEVEDLTLHGRLFAFFFNNSVDFFLCFFDEFFDFCRLNAAVGNQIFERKLGRYSAHRIERREGNRVRRVINDDFNSGSALKGLDVSPFLADNFPLNLVGGQSNRRAHHVGSGGDGQSLNGGGKNLAGASLEAFIAFGFKFFGTDKKIFLGLLLHYFHKLLLGFGPGESGHFGKFVFTLFDQSLNFFFEICQFSPFFLGIFGLTLQIGLAFIQKLFLLYEPVLGSLGPLLAFSEFFLGSL